MNDEALFSIESDLEPAFQTLLHDRLLIGNVYRSRERTEAATPRVGLKVAVGSIPKDKAHVHPFNDGVQWAFDVWTGTRLILEVTTQRETNGNQHAVLLGKIRAGLQMYRLVETWQQCGAQYHTFEDIREAGSTDSVNSDDNTDTTTIVFDLVNSIRTDVWGDT